MRSLPLAAACALSLVCLASACELGVRLPEAGPVTVEAFDRYLLPDGGVTAKPALSDVSEVEVVEVDGGTTLMRHPARQVAPGRYEVPDAPAGTVYVRAGRDWVVTGYRRDLDLSRWHVGRPDVAYAPGGEAPQVRVRLDNLEPLAADTTWRELVAYSPQTAFLATLQHLYDQPEGATRVDATLWLDSWTGTVPLFQPLRGDGWFVGQLTGRSTGTLANGTSGTYQALARGAWVQAPTTSPYDMAVQATLAPLAQQEVRVDARRAEFQGVWRAIHPSAAIQETSLWIELAPGTDRFIPSDVTLPAALWVDHGSGIPNGNVTLGYGNPSPPGWRPTGRLQAVFQLSPRPPGVTEGWVNAWVYVEDELERLVQGPVRPRVLPPATLTLEASPALEPREVTTTTPRLAWQAASSTPPSRYVVRVRKLDAFPGTPQLRAETVARFHLPGDRTELLLPSRLLEAGGHYLFCVGALQVRNDAPVARPADDRYPLAFAEACTGLVSVR